MLWTTMLAIGLVFVGFYEYDKLVDTQNTLVLKVDHRFKSYDFEYFGRHNYVLPNADKTRGRLCVDSSKRDDFYVGIRVHTPFYDFMRYLDCGLSDAERGITTIVVE